MITPTVLGTIKEKGDAIWKQVVPEMAELADIDAEDDPLEEDLMSPVPHLVHRYPDRVLLMVTNQCPIYCRFCTRKRLDGKPGFLKKGELDRAITYLREHQEVRDVILFGGDPLLLPDYLLERVLKALRTIPHLELIRIGSRVPGTLPQRITPKLCEMVKKYHPIYMNLHFNHPDELTPEVKAACGMLADAGVPLGAQTVLLKGVNDDPEIMKRLVPRIDFRLFSGFCVITHLRNHLFGEAVQTLHWGLLARHSAMLWLHPHGHASKLSRRRTRRRSGASSSARGGSLISVILEGTNGRSIFRQSSGSHIFRG